MTDQVLASALSAVASIAAVAASLLNRRKLTRIQVDINGRLNQLLKVTAEANHAAGIVEGIKRTKESQP